MILSNDTLTFEYDRENVIEEIYMNAGSSITIGGRRETTADVNYLKLTINLFLSQTEYIALANVIMDFTKEFFYTPSRLLAGKTSIEPIRVVMDETPDFQETFQTVNDVTEVGYAVQLVFYEVIV